MSQPLGSFLPLHAPDLGCVHLIRDSCRPRCQLHRWTFGHSCGRVHWTFAGRSVTWPPYKLHGRSSPEACSFQRAEGQVTDMSQRKAVVLLSGGLDSATILAIARDEGYAPFALSFRYGQRHTAELQAAGRVAAALGAVRHVVADIDLRVFGGSALTDASIAVPHHDSVDDLVADIPVTYVPARNTIFLSFALAW